MANAVLKYIKSFFSTFLQHFEPARSQGYVLLIMKLISSALSEHLILNMEMRFNQYYIVKIGFRKIKAFSVLAPLLVKWCPLHINDRLQLWIQNVHEVMKLFQ